MARSGMACVHEGPCRALLDCAHWLAAWRGVAQPVGSLVSGAKTLDQARAILTFVEAVQPRCCTPRNATPRNATSRNATPRNATPRNATQCARSSAVQVSEKTLRSTVVLTAGRRASYPTRHGRHCTRHDCPPRGTPLVAHSLCAEAAGSRRRWASPSPRQSREYPQ